MRRAKRSAFMFVALAAALTVVVPAPAAAAPAIRALPVRAPATLIPLTDISAERVRIADKVAAAKFGTPAPIDDPVREQVVLTNVRSLSIQMGIDPEVSVAIFRDQIEANKQIQRGLYELWTAHPELAPTERPDLATEVRPLLDRITVQLLEQIKATQGARTHPWCHRRLAVARTLISHVRHLDALHSSALRRALPSVCQVGS